MTTTGTAAGALAASKKLTSTPSNSSLGYFSSPNSTSICENTTTSTTTTSLTNLNDELINSKFSKKILVITHNDALDAELKIKESYLNQLKSIDLSKYSFPNENKPNTDYTYARTISYLSSANNPEETCEMPNLKRRSRLVKSNNSTLNYSSNEQLLASARAEKLIRWSFYERIKSIFRSTSRTETKSMASTLTKTETDTNFQFKIPNVQMFDTAVAAAAAVATSSSKDSASNSLRLNRNIGFELDETKSLKTNTSIEQNTSREQIKENKKKKNRLGLCCYIPFLILLLFLIPFGMFAAKQTENQSPLDIDEFRIYLDTEWTQPGIVCLKKISDTSFLYAEIFWLNLKHYALIALQEADRLKQLALENSFKKEVVYVPSSNDLKKQEEMIKFDLNSLKEKILGEAFLNAKHLTDNEMDLMRGELDKKFNYSLSSILNKLTDQAMQFEMSKQTHEKELKHMKDVLKELDARYSLIFNDLLDLKQKQEKKEKINDDASNIKASLSKTETISFEKIEEYINRTLYLYNADKTGMVDFASESIGGSILFTRCTETYEQNTRWFTVFDWPITRISVSPRVVIQGSIQPGNCWSFKGQKGDLFIKLAAKITPKSFSLEHIPKELSLTGNIDSAPQNFSVYGYINKDDIRDDNRILLGNYRFNNNSKSTLQFFQVQNKQTENPIAVVELNIESNSGNKDYTCVYKFRVHGELFKANRAKTADSSHLSNN